MQVGETLDNMHADVDDIPQVHNLCASLLSPVNYVYTVLLCFKFHTTCTVFLYDVVILICFSTTVVSLTYGPLALDTHA